jgi:hypothetical protein
MLCFCFSGVWLACKNNSTPTMGTPVSVYQGSLAISFKYNGSWSSGLELKDFPRIFSPAIDSWAVEPFASNPECQPRCRLLSRVSPSSLVLRMSEFSLTSLGSQLSQSQWAFAFALVTSLFFTCSSHLPISRANSFTYFHDQGASHMGYRYFQCIQIFKGPNELLLD